MACLRYLCLVCTLLPWRASCQDLFLPTTADTEESTGAPQNLAKAGFLAARPNGDKLGRVFDTSTVFTITIGKSPNLCLDLAKGHGTSVIQIWECNGLENQLWYFDAGSYQIQWAGDRTKCIDAGGGLTAGTQLFIWGCNGLSQQKWGFENGAIFLANSMGRRLEISETSETGAQVGKAFASLCMDVSGSSEGLGTAIQLWGCNNLWNQKFALQKGITIRVLANYNYCIDVSGGKMDNGTPLILWPCNGLLNQKWFWDSGTFNIKSAMDPSKCIDGGQGTSSGSNLMLWDCNGLSQQRWGFDSTLQTIWISPTMDSSKLETQSPQSGRPLASVCMDVSGGKIADGTNIQLWSCNACWNQQFQVVGPAITQKQGSEVQTSDDRNTLQARRLQGGGCAARPAPPPFPHPGLASKVLSNCAAGSQENWPQFNTAAELQKSPWGAYFQTVYGAIPTSGYPICTYALSMLYKPILAQAKVTALPVLPTADPHCPTQNGQYYTTMTDHQDAWSSWIWNSNLAQPQATKTALPDDYWVEIIHQAYFMDGDATWMYYTPGTAVWFHLGKTKAWDDHDDCVKEILKEACQAGGGWKADQHQCIPQYPRLYKAAIAAGYNSLQFLNHGDMPCGSEKDRKNMALEIVDLGGSGTNSCGQKFANAASQGQARYRAGWAAENLCTCDNSQKTVNCLGYGMNYAKKPIR